MAILFALVLAQAATNEAAPVEAPRRNAHATVNASVEILQPVFNVPMRTPDERQRQVSRTADRVPIEYF